MTKIPLQATDICKTFTQGKNDVPVLQKASFSLSEKEIVAIIGPSGCGKTTFLQLIGLLDTPDAGTITINDHLYSKSSTNGLCSRSGNGFIISIRMQ